MVASHLCSDCHHASSLQNICFKVAKILTSINPFAWSITNDLLHTLKFLFTKWFFNCKRSFRNLFMILHIVLIFCTIFFIYILVYFAANILPTILFACYSWSMLSWNFITIFFFATKKFDFFVQSMFCLLTHSNNSPFHDFWHNPYCCSLALLVHALLWIKYINLFHSWLLLPFSSFFFFSYWFSY